MTAADIHAIFVIAEVERGIVVQTGAALQARRVNPAPGTVEIRRSADQQRIALTRDADDPAVNELVISDGRLVWSGRPGRVRVAWIGANGIQSRLLNEFIEGRGLQQMAALIVNPYVLPRDLDHKLSIRGDGHFRTITVGYTRLAGGKARATVAVKGAYNR